MVLVDRDGWEAERCKEDIALRGSVTGTGR